MENEKFKSIIKDSILPPFRMYFSKEDNCWVVYSEQNKSLKVHGKSEAEAIANFRDLFDKLVIDFWSLHE